MRQSVGRPSARELLDTIGAMPAEYMPVDALAERVEKVLARHVREETSAPAVSYCFHCEYEWPCPTVRLLNGEE
jgi:hypothetical protein